MPAHPDSDDDRTTVLDGGVAADTRPSASATADRETVVAASSDATPDPRADESAGATNVARDDAAGETDEPLPVEIGGQKGPEPTRYGDWEKKGRCTDF